MNQLKNATVDYSGNQTSSVNSKVNSKFHSELNEESAKTESAIYTGEVFHQRFTPKNHQFTYSLFLLWLDLHNLPSNGRLPGLSEKSWLPVKFNRSDYLDSPDIPLAERALQCMSELAGETLQGKVFLLGQVRMLGWYFSPVNFYYLQQSNGQFSHMLAEVSNTPWNKRHHYLIDLAESRPVTQKDFHVSPFNPMDMDYHWQITQPASTLNVSIACHKNDEGKQKHFEAAIAMNKMPLTSKNLLKEMTKIPSTALKTVWGIYWQAIKLFIKRVPFYSYPK